VLQVTIIQIQRIEPANQTTADPLHHDTTYRAEHCSLIRAAHHTVSFVHTKLLKTISCVVRRFCFLCIFFQSLSACHSCCNAAYTCRGRLEQLVPQQILANIIYIHRQVAKYALICRTSSTVLVLSVTSHDS